ncbi:6-pyruvoyl tetrahydropterin reductase [Aliikangiella marina]|uniref:6-carboxy-5,6,7,8-tetrahydropterin synthase n=2 Tax=Aliikangiella marina TaxID=1712262 RepID=A0A545TK34_9GAMM|nr:6-pyruvoyl tetrahydropterin reductase [Aliikangiella marina]
MQALFVDNLTVIDFSYFHPHRGIVGESLILDVILHGELNEEGMLFDFSFVKKRIKSCVDSLVDHKFLVARKTPLLKVTESPQQLELQLVLRTGEHYTHVSPEQAVYFVDSDEVTPETIAASINHEIKKILPENVTRVDLNLRAELIEGDFYHYSHGLKKHFGDCQRIAHGHRSKIEVWENDYFSAKWSSHIAKMWQDIYLATQDDIIERPTIKGAEYLTFQYHANQGTFKLTMPAEKCFIMNTDTTVELIALFLANYLKQQVPEAEFKVKAYEGVDKGAIAIR